MASVRKRGKGYTVRWRDSLGRNRSRQAPDYQTAQKIRREIERARAEGRDWESRPARVVRLSVAALFAAYLRERRHVLQESSIRRTERRLLPFVRWLEDQHGQGAAGRHLSRRCLVAYLDHQIATGVAEVTRWRRVRVVEQVWAWLWRTEEYREHVPPPSRVEMVPPPDRRTVAPTWEHMDAMIGVCSGQLRRLAVLLRFTGLRLSQARGLLWSDVDLEEGELTVRPELGKTRQEAQGRTVPISRHLVDELRSWAPGEGVIAQTRGGGLRRAWVRSGVPEHVWGSPGPGRNAQPAHCFRKGFATGLRRAGADPDAVEYLLGHARGLAGVYIDPTALPLRRVVDLVPALGEAPSE